MDDDKEQNIALSPYFRLWLCGPFRIERHVGQGYEPIRTAEWGGSSYPRLVLKALLCCPARRARRESLLEMLWSEDDPEQAAQFLNTGMTKLRRVLCPTKGSESLLVTQDDASVYHLQDQSLLWVDADTALALLKEVEQLGWTCSEGFCLLQEAMSYLDAGSFLEDEDGLWLAGRRGEVEVACYNGRLWLAEAYEQQDMLVQAELQLRKLLADDPSDEDVLSRLLLLLHRHGMKYKALQAYHEFTEAAKQEGVEPTGELSLLAASLRADKRYYSVAPAKRPGIDEGEAPSPEPFSDGLLVASTFVLSEMALEGAESARVLGERTMRLTQAIIRWHRGAGSCGQLQGLLHQELERWTTMTTSNQNLLISRRMALATLAAMPLTLVPAILGGQHSPLVLEEFLPECTTSLTACWHLMREGDFTTIATQLPKYLPALELLAQQPSRYQKTAAHLTTQGYLLMYHVALENLNLPLTKVYCQRADCYSRIAEDQALSLAVMTRLAYTFLDKSLSIYEKALAVLSDSRNQTSASLQHNIFLYAAACYAQNGQVQQALWCLGKTRETPLEQLHDEPIPSKPWLFPPSDWGTLLWTAQAYEYLGNLALYQGLSQRPRLLYTVVQQTLIQVEKLIPEPGRVEVILHQAKTGIDLGDRDMFQTYFQAGVQQTKGLSSPRIKQGAIDDWKLARLRWPDEVVIKDLADLLL